MTEKIYTIKKMLKGSGLIVFGFLFSLYFGYHLMNGKRGISAYRQLSKEVAQLELINRELEDQKRTIENKIAGLSSSKLDLDLLDESARVVLSMAKEGEYIIYW